ncbi:MAG TPA: ParB/RepB/Spo0J family partition protein [Candidatus Dormibacteraeota bacterium]|nr:ParB/RepB/Spo0J family partition protein [Candidatus Dormibacteraeota bacterium]
MTQAHPRGLGRGLEALIPMSRQGGAMVPQMIAVDQIRPSRLQVRARFDSEPLGELADSIRRHGVLQPILVRRHLDGYELIAGERRWRAARLAGLASIPAVVRTETEADEQLVLGLIENLQRTDLGPIEEARGLQRLTEELGLTHEEAAQRIGKNRVSVTQSLRLLSACPAVQSAVGAGAITAGHARALLALETAGAQEHGLKVVLGRRLSVRQTENWVRSYRPRRVAGRGESAELRALGAELESKLGLPVRFKGTGNRGRLEIKYSSREELERVCAKLLT